MVERFKQLGNLTLVIAWAVVFLLLPITSLPLLSRLAGGSDVAPAALLPLGWLALFWFIPYLIRRGSIPRESIPFIFFFSIAIISSAAAFFLNIPPYKDTGVLHEEIRAVLTLTIGASFYLITASWFSKSEARLAFILKWINVSGMLVILWALVQALYIFLYHNKYPAILSMFQQLVSTQEFYPGRITSFAFEPSWLAHQMNLLFVPFWLGATISGTSAHRFRIWKFTLENLLLLIGAGVVFLASRVGTLALLLVLTFVALYANIILVRRVHRWSLTRFVRFSPGVRKVIRILLPVILWLVLLGIYLFGAVGLVYGLSYVDPRLARFFEPLTLVQWETLVENPYIFFNYLNFAERYVYWVSGWNIFNLHPFLGVGLGNSGFFFQHELPSYSWRLPEVMGILYRASILPNIKSLWVRLLAETGIAGFSSFFTWLYILFRQSWIVRLGKNPLFRMIGWSGLFVMVAYLIEGFSTDTFALPYLWVSLGIVSAVGALSRNAPEST